MNDLRRLIGLLVIAALGILIGYVLGWHGSDEAARETAGLRADDDDDDAPDRRQSFDGQPAIRLSAADQRRGGIELTAPQPTTIRAEARAIGEVLDLQPLFELRSVLAARRADAEATRALLENAEQTLQRLRALHAEDGNISMRQLQAAQVEHDGVRLRFRALEVQAADARARILHDWGPVLLDWAASESSVDFARLLANDNVVLLVTLNQSRALDAAPEIAFVNERDDRSPAREAVLISPAPRTATAAQRQTFFFRTERRGLRVGTRLHAWLPVVGGEQSGVHLPSAAVVWHAGRPWIYVHRPGELFLRRPIEELRVMPGGWFSPDLALQGERIVASGAQTLLSEEFRSQIPDEDDDP